MLERSARNRFFSGALVLAAVYVVASTFSARAAFAKRDGVPATNCSGCHGSAREAEIQASAQPAAFNPGDAVTVTLSVRLAGSKVGGVFIAEPGIGQLTATNSELKVAPGGLVHSAPKNATADGVASFQFAWRAPGTPGAVHFEVAALSGNGDGRSSGDAAAASVISFVYGCSPETFVRDLDGDGYGSETAETIVDCAGMPPEGFSTSRDDCDDSYENVFPGAAEICNKRDDDCDGTVDEGAPPVELWPDEDGDGYYSLRTGTSMLGCVPLAGYAADSGDCAPRDAMRHPGATEVCNLLDDNCDGRIDERLRPQCGIGLCLRNSVTCEPEACQPGEPVPEACNLFDDDCDGVVDDAAPCAEGRACVDGACVVGGVPSPSGGSNAGGAPGGVAAGGVGVGGRPGALGGASGSLGGRSGSGTSSSDGGNESSPAASGGRDARPPASARSAGGCGIGRSGGSTLGWLCVVLVAAASASRRRL